MTQCTSSQATQADVEAAQLVEWSEAQAYAALIGGAPAEVREHYALATLQRASAVALVAGGFTRNLVLNRVLGLGTSTTASGADLDAFDELYRDAGVASYAIELSPVALPADLIDQLRERSFMPFKLTTMMIRRCTPIEPPPSSLQVRRATTADADNFAALCCEVFGYPDPVPALLRATFDSAAWQHWFALEAGRPVAAAMTHLWGDTAWIGWVCTRAEHRGKGAQNLLAAAQVRGAADAGARIVTLETATGTQARPGPSLRNYRRLGWTAVHNRLVYVRRANAQGI